MASGIGGDVDGVRIVRRASWRRATGSLAALVLGAAVALLARRAAEDTPSVAPPRDAGRRRAVVGPEHGAPADRPDDGRTPDALPTSRGARLRALRAAGVRPTKGPDGTRELSAGPVIDALRKAGVTDGIAAFPPPGTDPPKSGIIVPDDWVLPEGYVRHHQVTDDGEQLPPILMFHPDYDFEDEHGRKIVLPPDRVVPPELAPPGLSVRMLDVPGRAR